MATIVQDGATEDLIRAFQQMACAEGHYKTLIEKYQSELENGLIDVEDENVRNAHLDKLNGAIEELGMLAELRRSTMWQVMDAYEGDKNYWCLVKHLSMAEYTMFEAYQASDNDAALLNLYLAANARFVNAVTRWLGTEITSCASCLGDILKGVKKDGI